MACGWNRCRTISTSKAGTWGSCAHDSMADRHSEGPLLDPAAELFTELGFVGEMINLHLPTERSEKCVRCFPLHFHLLQRRGSSDKTKSKRTFGDLLRYQKEQAVFPL